MPHELTAELERTATTSRHWDRIDDAFSRSVEQGAEDKRIHRSRSQAIVGSSEGSATVRSVMDGSPTSCLRRRVYAAAFIFLSRRASRYFLMVAFERALCFPQTIPKIGAAGFLHPGTGHS